MPRYLDGAGYSLIDLSDSSYVRKIVALMYERGFPLGNTSNGHFGGGGYSQHGRWIQDGDGGGSGADGADEHTRAEMGGGFGGVQLGYLLIDSAWLRLYPLAGIGGMGFGYGASPASGGEPIYAYTLAPTVSFGVGIELRLPITRRFSPMIGVRFGYRYALRSYHAQENGAPEMPPQAPGGLFFRVIFGAGLNIG